MERLIELMESRIRRNVYVRFGGEHLKTYHSNMARRWVLSLHIRWYLSVCQKVPFRRSASTIPQVSQHHSRSWKSPHILFIPTQAFR